MKNPLLSEAAIELARDVVAEVDDSGAGKHLGVAVSGNNVVTHRFAARVPGYPGWEWHAVLAHADGSVDVTVNEVALVPGRKALQAPDWVPYSQRLRPEDLGPGDLMPPAADDPRLDAAGQLTAHGAKAAKDRWMTGNRGPNTEMAAKAPMQCRTCAFQVALGEPLGPHFGVCTNEYSADGEVVHATYGCGAHSKVKVAEEGTAEITPFDDEKPVF
ncbi:hypothetical protein CPHO_09210 [Corynebacterium phocae]|uniref:DUF3027 domain-containing protein n=1 Tax=Corynebacterium phocae TaxID=161895 RepID=A0A1L7D530_9CORY|nr:DUF3027 domain-containing protein [Corynebacterium phocae]APT93032.1 hypothetical protein CPHO_09210 [Corynebacterium phocae]KAA8722533.1 DUF3027 domain-containing protein [Corynebacterium phocae]